MRSGVTRAGLKLATACAAVGLAQCDRDRPEPAAPAPAPSPPPISAPAELSRAELIAALDRAASAYAARQDPSEASGLAGRTFLALTG